MINLNRSLRRTKRLRQGAVMIIAIIALVLCSAASLSMFRTTILRQKRFELRHNQLQAQLLADSAIDRAASNLAVDTSFRNEDWSVELNGEQGEVAISLEETKTSDFDLNIRSTYPLETTRRVQVSLETLLTAPEDKLSMSEDGEESTP